MKWKIHVYVLNIITTIIELYFSLPTWWIYLVHPYFSGVFPESSVLQSSTPGRLDFSGD